MWKTVSALALGAGGQLQLDLVEAVGPDAGVQLDAEVDLRLGSGRRAATPARAGSRTTGRE